jgi:hypothetical protein
MIERAITPHLLEQAGHFPVVTILGPRQSGKTTLARHAFPDHRYANLERGDLRELAERDTAAFFRAFPPPVVIDEVQRVPTLLSEIQVLVDEDRQPGRFILTGSHQPRLREGIAQSLAGRTGLLRLLPFSLDELASAGMRPSRDEAIFRGFFPGIVADGVPPGDYLDAYLETYAERDVRQLVNLSDASSFRLFLRLLAGRVGQVANLQSLAGDVGVTATTLAHWLSVLEASFLVFRLPPCFENFGKRFVKSPKIYFADVGLAAHLLQIEEPGQVARDPLLGGLFENLVVLEALKARRNAGQPPDLYYLRNQSRMEIDLLLGTRRRFRAVEIKAAMTRQPDQARHLEAFRKLAGDRLEKTAVSYAGDLEVSSGGTDWISFRNTARWLSS